MSERITVCINTKDRLEYLLMTLSSLLAQTYQNWDLIICDASAEPVINSEQLPRLLKVMKIYGHNVRYERDESIGIPHSYQRMMEMAETDLCIRQEDDIWMEPEMIQLAYDTIMLSDNCAAVGFMTPNFNGVSGATPAPDKLRNGFVKKTSSPLAPQLPFIYEAVDQQSIVVLEDKIWKVCTIHGGSLYRKSLAQKINGFCTEFSPVGHREETLFYLRLYMKGYDLFVRSTSRLWHFESTAGGSRPEGAHAESRQNMRRADESKFQGEFNALIEAHPDRPVYIIDG